ncbi:MAG: radical SAM/SPASM domain-containing protein [Rhizomicrobium sp.]
MAGVADNDEIAAVLNYAAVLHKNGWTAEAYRVCQILVANGISVDLPQIQSVVEGYSRLDPATQGMGAHQPLAVMRGDQMFSTLHLTSDLTDHQKRVAFKSGVGFINIETSSQCNRNCSYCPNSIYDRRKDNVFFDWPAYERILDDLASIDYSRRISLVGLNEPLMHLEDFVARLKAIRARLPRCYILIFTNGDYLTKAAFTVMEECGVNELKVAIHLSKDKLYDERDILKRTLDKSRELGLHPVLTNFTADKEIEFRLSGSSMCVRYSQANYMTEGNNRGEVLKGVGRKMAARTAACLQAMDNFIINYKGDVLPCCATIGSSPEVAPYVVGNVQGTSIFDIYCSEKFSAWRRDTMANGPKKRPCATCPEQWGGFPQNWDAIVHKALAAVGAGNANPPPSSATEMAPEFEGAGLSDRQL